MTDELLGLAERLKYLEVPLENFSSVDLGKEHEVHELEGMLGYWFGNFSRDAVWNVREIILTGTNPLRDRLLRETSPNVVGLLRIKSLPVESINYVRGPLGVRNTEQLKKACRASVLSKSGEFSEQEELDILEDILNLEKQDPVKTSKEADAPSGAETFLCLETKSPEIADVDTMFLANADALADAIIASLQAECKTTGIKGVGEQAVKETLVGVRDQARGVVDKFRRFFTSRSDPRYRQMRLEENERARVQAERRASAELEALHAAAVNAPLELVKVGPLGRAEPALSQLDFLIKTDDTEAAFERVRSSAFVKEILSQDVRRLSVSLRPDFFTVPFNNRPTPPATLNFYTASEFTWGTKEVLLTSSREHWNMLTERATSKGWKLTALGLYDGVNRISSRTSERLYEKLGFPFVPAELRQGTAERDWITAGTPELIKLEDLRADLHLHTTFSDGLNEIEEMASTGQALGYDFIAATDHTKNAAIANGMTDAEILHCWDVIDGVNESMKASGVRFRILKGAEVDVLEDGGLDLTDETLSHADWIVASIHFGKRQPQKQLHRRYLDAFQNPFVDVIAHPTQRVIGSEPPMDVDVEFLCENAKKYGKCLELNSQPRRLDLDYRWLKLAKDYAVPIVVSTDAHAASQMEYLRFGVQQARKAGLTRHDVLNTLSYHDFMERRRILKANAAR